MTEWINQIVHKSELKGKKAHYFVVLNDLILIPAIYLWFLYSTKHLLENNLIVLVAWLFLALGVVYVFSVGVWIVIIGRKVPARIELQNEVLKFEMYFGSSQKVNNNDLIFIARVKTKFPATFYKWYSQNGEFNEILLPDNKSILIPVQMCPIDQLLGSRGRTTVSN